MKIFSLTQSKSQTNSKFNIDELIELDQFLKKQTSNMTAIKAHGFITAVASFPDLFMPSEWIPVLVGELQDSSDQHTIRVMLNILVNIYRQVTNNLNSDSEFKFILAADDPLLTLDKAPYSNIREWCDGYCLALTWNDKEWLHSEEDFVKKACTTFFQITDALQHSEHEQLFGFLPKLVKMLYTYWISTHNNLLMYDLRNMHNEHCPCGSNKAYYECCLVNGKSIYLH